MQKPHLMQNAFKIDFFAFGKRGFFSSFLEQDASPLEKQTSELMLEIEEDRFFISCFSTPFLFEFKDFSVCFLYSIPTKYARIAGNILI